MLNLEPIKLEMNSIEGVTLEAQMAKIREVLEQNHFKILSLIAVNGVIYIELEAASLNGHAVAMHIMTLFGQIRAELAQKGS